MPDVRGRAAIRAFVGNVFSTTRIDRIDVTTEELDVYGDTGYERGTYSEAYTVQGQGAKQERGRYVLVWKRQPDGAWRIHRFLGNHIVPPA
jgi:ketosteroid isomerase-like protein